MMMNKAEKMVAINKKKHSEQEKKTIDIINKMLVNDEQVTISELRKRTGMSRSYFYNNKIVSDELARARSLQVGKEFNVQRKTTLDKVIEIENSKLKKELSEANKKVDELIEMVNKQKNQIKKLKNQVIDEIK